jgi:hypothetical protein
MKKLTLLLLTLAFISCSKPEKVEIKDPFKSGEIVYLKLDTTKVLIKMKLGQFDEENFSYWVTYKNGDKVEGKIALSSELFK